MALLAGHKISYIARLILNTLSLYQGTIKEADEAIQNLGVGSYPPMK